MKRAKGIRIGERNYETKGIQYKMYINVTNKRNMITMRSNVTEILLILCGSHNSIYYSTLVFVCVCVGVYYIHEY